MFLLPPEFEPYMELWYELPRRAHTLLPSKGDISPQSYGELLKNIAMTEMRGFRNLHLTYVGSVFEQNASLNVSGRNYYDLLPVEFHKPMYIFHHNLLGTPCGAYVCDVIETRSGSRYTHETVQLPLADENGNVRFLMAYGTGRKPYTDKAGRTAESHRPASIKMMYYIDLGAGAPADYVENFEFHRARTA